MFLLSSHAESGTGDESNSESASPDPSAASSPSTSALSTSSGPLAKGTIAVVALSGAVMALSGPGQTAGLSVFVDHIIGDLGISRSIVSAAYLVGTLGGAVVLPWIGRAVDHFGVRRMLTAIALTFGAFLTLLAVVHEIVGLTVAFVGVRAMGRGGMTLVATTAVATAVTRKRGTALGITSAVGAAGISLFPLLAEMAIVRLGWRSVLMWEAALVWAVILPIAWWGMRGVTRAQADEASTESASETAAEPAWPLRAVVRTSMFWLVTSAVAVAGLTGTALFFHQIAVLGEQGLSSAQAAANFLPQTVAGLLAALAFSSAADRFSPKLLIFIAMMMHVGAMAMLPFVSPGVSALVYGMALGAAGAGARSVEAAAMPFYFGTEVIGSLRGLTQSVAVSSTAIAPLLLSLGHDLVGSYAPVVLVLAILPAGVALVAPFARVPTEE
ncbi:MFS transporter [Nocardiopsis gilva YIM 90087]|uniref:MFS transporter n=1 Tax=Nocardiopsis gilva YIM 90087 TaxID=1235441 RepID=A0A223SCZ1_9ACTN|nr:MFS transporter [Nocardiopsis gilva]ASU85889.1 MFS transporter [Nocardiopsis gilva YIM 90087]